MNYKLFGRTGIYISPLILGCMMFGQKTNYKDIMIISASVRSEIKAASEIPIKGVVSKSTRS